MTNIRLAELIGQFIVENHFYVTIESGLNIPGVRSLLEELNWGKSNDFNGKPGQKTGFSSEWCVPNTSIIL